MADRSSMQIADEKKAGYSSFTIKDGVIVAINIVDRPMYWYDNEWHPRPKEISNG